MTTDTLDRPLTIEESGTYRIETVTVDMNALRARLIEEARTRLRTRLIDQARTMNDYAPAPCGPDCPDCHPVDRQTLRQNVARGARALDQALPFWANHIDLDPETFDISVSTDCICGQLTREYGEIPFDDMDTNLGFYTRDGDGCLYLEDCWRAEVNARLEVPV
jgi:hypothetical protein